jgi:hypothetical protein
MSSIALLQKQLPVAARPPGKRRKLVVLFLIKSLLTYCCNLLFDRFLAVGTLGQWYLRQPANSVSVSAARKFRSGWDWDYPAG